jgi:DNA-directed RNA polymerase beta subunit
MAYLNPNEAYEHFRDRTFEGIRAHFPLKGRRQTLELEKLETDDEKLHPDDLRAQHEAKLEGNSYAVPVMAHLVLKNTQTGEVIDRKKMRLAEIPKMTQRYSYIVDGQEYQMDNQWQLKPGAYVRRRKSGELETRFNVKNGQSFDVVLDDKSKQFFAEYKKAKVPLYPLMKTMGVDDDTLERSWGKEIFNASKGARGVDGAMERMYKTMTKQSAPSKDHAQTHIFNALTKSEMRPDST